MKTAAFVAAFGLALAAVAGAQDGGFKLVVNASNSITTLTKEEAAQYFLKKKANWPGGQTAQPVDLMSDSSVRAAFSRAVLKKDIGAVKSYWQLLIFSGRGVPPPHKPSDEAVLEFVAANPGAIGYVSAEAAFVSGVKEVRIN
jgi:ABC-type phosphate transport system substrate-binding protein